MFVSLLLLGLMLTAAGLVTIGFGIPNHAFGLGNTLILAGTTTAVGGLILIGLAAAVRQLRRIAEALRTAPRPARPAEPAAESSHVPPTARMAPPPIRARAPEVVMPRPSEPRPAPEPRVAAPPQNETAGGPLSWLRPKASSAAHAESPVVEISDEAPLSPRSSPRPALSPLTNLAEVEAWSPSRTDESKPLESRHPAPTRAEQIARVAPGERPHGGPKESGLFEVSWPDPKARPLADTPDVKADAPPHPRDEAEKHSGPPLGLERPVGILKSGVIEGMAYTLYVDGSIEAELPQGTVRFASVDALRAHLDQYG